MNSANEELTNGFIQVLLHSSFSHIDPSQSPKVRDKKKHVQVNR